MKSLLNNSEKENIVNRINSLTLDSKAIWGKMNVNQMLSHCIQPLHVAVGELKLKRGLIGVLFGGMIRKKLLKAVEFDKNSPTDPSFKIHGIPEFEETKLNLIAAINKFNESEITKEPHPFFGKMTIEEWDNLAWKHLDHHLRQFGA